MTRKRIFKNSRSLNQIVSRLMILSIILKRKIHNNKTRQRRAFVSILQHPCNHAGALKKPPGINPEWLYIQKIIFNPVPFGSAD
jgi:hypothetical protein